MTHNPDEDTQPDFTPQMFTAFEKQLRSRSLGSGPQNRDDILYQCGFAAGVAFIRAQQDASSKRWRLLGIAASLLAAVSLSLQLGSMMNLPWKQPISSIVQPDQRRDKTSLDADELAPRQRADLNVSYAQRNQPASVRSLQSRSAVLTHIDIDQVLQEESDISSVIFPSTANRPYEILQPKDYSRILSGEA